MDLFKLKMEILGKIGKIEIHNIDELTKLSYNSKLKTINKMMDWFFLEEKKDNANN